MSFSTPYESAICIIGVKYLFASVSQQGDVDLSKSTSISWFFSPFHVTELRVDGATEDFTSNVSEFGCLIRELKDFGWAYECEI